jgi:hypothetical protein
MHANMRCKLVKIEGHRAAQMETSINGLSQASTAGSELYYLGFSVSISAPGFE